jgi:zinc protease
MTIFAPRPIRTILTSLIIAGMVVAAPAPKAPVPRPVPPRPAPAKLEAPKPVTPWLFKGSDIPPDKAWTFGEMPNGVRYAIRNNGVPPGQVSIRLAIDAGSIMESPSELGFAHFNEHLAFRGSKYVTDGEAKRVWQRLGASFGSDTNAATTSTQTIYKLDLPRATTEGLDETVKILSGMMGAPSITQAEVDAERRTVLAELREGEGPDARVGDATRSLYFGGQLLGTRPTIGTIASLNAASPATLRAFHDRWYRPENTVIAISGDVEPAQVEALIKKYFAPWKVEGPRTPHPDFGVPSATSPMTKFLTEPGSATVVSLAYVRPWVYKDDTIVMNQGRLVEMLATQIINRRLETRARAGGSYIGAQISTQDISRSVNGTFVSILPIGNDWLPALHDVRAVLADAITTVPTQDEIDRETSEIVSAFDIGVENASVEASSKQADDIVEAVNIRETVASPTVARDIFTALKGKITPEQILDASKKLFVGVGPRAFVSSKVPVVDGEKKLATAMAQPVKALVNAGSKSPVTFAQLPKFGPAGSIVKDGQITGLETRTLTLSNGVTAMLSTSPYEAGRIFVAARFGNGRQALPKDRVSPVWAASSALMSSGIGALVQNDIDRMLTGRKIGLEFEVGDDAFTIRGATRPADLNDQLKLIAAKLGTPGWDPAPINRAKASFLVESGTWGASPQGIISRELELQLHGGDKRWANPTQAEAQALTPQTFKAFWEPLLKTGDLEVSIFGDFEMEGAVKALTETFGALPRRAPAKKLALSGQASGPIATPKPLVRTHTGNADQAAGLLAWPTSGGIDNAYESRVLDILAAIYTDRMFELFREADGASYSPNVFSSWPTGLSSGGSFVVLSQIKPDGVENFFTRSKSIAADLIAKPVTADELKRAVGPVREQLIRATSGKWFWMQQLAGATTDPRRIAALRSWPSDLARVTPEALQAAAVKYLQPTKAFSMVILPTKKK